MHEGILCDLVPVTKKTAGGEHQAPTKGISGAADDVRAVAAIDRNPAFCKQTARTCNKVGGSAVNFRT